jgi:hypothetical protein
MGVIWVAKPPASGQAVGQILFLLQSGLGSRTYHLASVDALLAQISKNTAPNLALGLDWIWEFQEHVHRTQYMSVKIKQGLILPAIACGWVLRVPPATR